MKIGILSVLNTKPVFEIIYITNVIFYRFQEQAFIARKAKDKKKTHRLMKTTQQSPLVIANEAQNKKTKKKLEKDTATISRFSQEVCIMYASV